MTIPPADCPAVSSRLALPVAIFTAVGKRAAMVEALEPLSARVAIGMECPDGSIAILVRHGIRIVGTLHRMDDAGARFDFDDPLDGWRQAKFVDDRGPARPVRIAGSLAS